MIYEVVAISLLLGLFCAVLSDMIIFGLGYGHLLSWIKENKAEKLFARIGLLDMWEDAIDEMESMGYEEAGERIKKAYDYIRARHTGFGIYSCTYCLCTRISIIVGFISAMLLFYFAADSLFLLVIPLTPVFSWALIRRI